MQKIYQNARLTGIRHIHTEDKLVLSFDNAPEREFTSVVDFVMHGFYPHNILFDLYEYDLSTLPPRIAAEFPNLSYYMHSGDNWQIFYLSPQAGLGGVIVCATL
ncbi:hypothetical protein [Alysiella filiformis]|uniref:Uncharacterized protein n=1 Tax=Alysiella filiformis DSM 16848 TaxID=1120981 RepID=A0A286E233_9NEIS|nr:hypothetical protein [Alysiella filiformis]QMT30845.1 hypothetical protein H3L97_08890 [Alysiella filiformis]UBQ56173.1 hypothetical protein JF568_11585 [Alysiella filiformis DSM 16848]SOD64954.1 hypothetical protein SAMN02746062_00128 [Alysiella filiformis DSM 16848]